MRRAIWNLSIPAPLDELAVLELEGEEGLNHIEEYSDGNTERGRALRNAICKKFNFSSLEFQTLENLEKAIGVEPCKLCTYCWNGKV